MEPNNDEKTPMKDGFIPSDFGVRILSVYKFQAQISGNGPVMCEIMHLEPKK